MIREVIDCTGLVHSLRHAYHVVTPKHHHTKNYVISLMHLHLEANIAGRQPDVNNLGDDAFKARAKECMRNTCLLRTHARSRHSRKQLAEQE